MTEPRLVAQRAELARSMDYWRWCWDCGAREMDCDQARPERKCCPDCRHRDADPVRTLLGEMDAANLALAEWEQNRTTGGRRRPVGEPWQNRPPPEADTATTGPAGRP